jgi:hypothetical protein
MEAGIADACDNACDNACDVEAGDADAPNASEYSNKIVGALSFLTSLLWTPLTRE